MLFRFRSPVWNQRAIFRVLYIASSSCNFVLSQEQSQLTSVDHMGGVNAASFAAMEQSRMLANTLAQNHDPKFQVYNASLQFSI